MRKDAKELIKDAVDLLYEHHFLDGMREKSKEAKVKQIEDNIGNRKQDAMARNILNLLAYCDWSLQKANELGSLFGMKVISDDRCIGGYRTVPID